jgi:toxin FitB
VIVLDTNVVSAMMRAEVEPLVVQWLDQRPPESIWITSITIFEVRVGIERLAQGRRQRQLTEAFARVLDEDIEGRVLPFDSAAAQQAAILSIQRERRGEPVEQRDAWIAGIVISRRAELATRNVRHFRDLDVAVIDPWAT